MYFTPNKALMSNVSKLKHPRREPSLWQQLIWTCLDRRKHLKLSIFDQTMPNLNSLPVIELNLHHIFYTHYEDQGKTKPIWTNVNFVAVQRMVTHHLQGKVLEVVSEVLREKTMDDDKARKVQKLLHLLCQAIRDREYMKKFAEQGYKKNPFVLTSEKTYDALLLSKNNLILPSPNPEEYSLPSPIDLSNSELPGAPWDYESSTKAARRRFMAAISGGMALIAPMLIMVLVHATPVATKLLTVSFFTVAFAVVLAMGSERNPLEITTATAAYAAILVVFVGTNLA